MSFTVFAGSKKRSYWGVERFLQRTKAAFEWSKQNGAEATFWRLRSMHEISIGELKGTDQFGNEYYENREARVPGRHRFVVYKNVKDFHHDATGVPPEWHSWLCHMYDETPVEDPPSKPFFQLQHKQYNPNQMGLNANYLPPNHFLRLNTPAQPKYKSWYDKEEGTLITGKTDVDEDTKKLDSK